MSQVTQVRKLAAELVEFEYGLPPNDVRTLLKLAPGEEAQRVVRVRRSKAAPVMHLTTYVSGAIGRTYARKDLERESLYQLLARAGQACSKAQEAVGACLADPIVAPLLKVDVGAPLLLVQRLLSAADDKPVEYLELHASPESYMLTRSWDMTTEPVELVGGIGPYSKRGRVRPRPVRSRSELTSQLKKWVVGACSLTDQLATSQKARPRCARSRI